MANVWILFKRELSAYFSTPIAYVFLVIFVVLSGVFTFYVGSYFERDQADLRSFFQFHPWLTLPITMTEAVLGKFFAAWAFSAIALMLTTPLWLTTNYLGNPDNGVILASYVGSLLMAGAFLAIGACMSALTRNQVIAFVITAAVCLGFVLSGYPLVLEFVGAFAPEFVVEAVGSFSFLSHFTEVSKGVIDVRDLVFFLSLMAYWLFANAGVVELKKAE